MSYVYSFLGWIMNWCYSLLGNYGWAIVLFTLITKIILLPLFLWTYFNSITMIKIQPDINFIKVRYYGQKDQIAEEQAKLFKEKHYSPMASVIPTVVQLFLLMGVVGVIRMGIENPAIDMSFGPINLGEVPAEVGIRLIWSPIVAGLAAWILCIAQNASNVLQAEQSKWNKYGMTVLSVGLSLYLGWFVPVGTAFYWVWSNLFAVLQLYVTNWIVRPRRFVDYERLEESRRQLEEIQNVGKKKRESYFSENRRRERADYKRFFSVVNKHLVFYSESNGFYKYFKGYIEYILNHTNITIHYITSDPDDHIFELERENSQIRAYYVGENRLITLMMKMDADVVCMTMPDLENYHIKRSYVRNDVEYVYIPHAMDSENLTTRKGARDHFDTIFCAGPHSVEEVRQTEIVYGLKPKKCVEVGFPLLDEMRRNYAIMEKKENKKKIILIAPSWQKDNIIDLCLEEILNELKDCDYQIVVRPHPQQVKYRKEYFEALKEQYCQNENILIQTDFSSTDIVWKADLLVTDWSGISMEYALTSYKPVLFINTPMKIMNPEYEKIKITPINIEMRDQIGKNLNIEDIPKIREQVQELLSKREEYAEIIKRWASSKVFNNDTQQAAETGGKYLIETIQQKVKKRRSKDEE